MARRGHRSGGKRPLFGELRRRIVSWEKSSTASVEEVVDHLLSYRDYSNQKLQPFTSHVQTILQQLKPNPKPIEEETPLGSKRRLQLLEAKHMTNRQRNKNDGDGESSTLASTSESSDSHSSSENTDAIYGAKPDLMRIMLQNSYNQLENSTPKSKKIEYEVIHDDNGEKGKKIGMLKEGQQRRDLPKLVGGDGERIADSDANGGPTFKDLGGMDALLEELKIEVIVPLFYPQLFRHLGVRPMSGILFHGPPGCGKTKLAHAIANETRVPFYKLSATELVSGVSGASEEKIRELFSKAYRTAPSIVFIDEIDAIASKRENLQREMERRIVTQLMTCMDESHRPVKPDDNGNGTTLPTDKRNIEAKSDGEPGYVLVIGATNRPDAIDPALRRPGRFDREIALGIPDENARVQILSVLTRNLRVEGAFDLMKIARSTPGFVGADLASLTTTAGNLAIKRTVDVRKVELSRELIDGEDAIEWWRMPWSPEEMEKLCINMADFEEAAKLVQPSSRREGFSAIPNVKWEDVGGLDSLRHDFDRYIIRRIKNPKDYMVDSLTTKRDKYEGSLVVERLLNQLLIELDGADQRVGVYVIGATNRPGVLDKAILRPGRLGRLLYVPLPSPDERGLILKALARKKPIDSSVDMVTIGRDDDACKNFSGADLAALMNEAAMVALEDKLMAIDTGCGDTSSTIKESHFKRALEKISPSISDEQIKCYERFRAE